MKQIVLLTLFISNWCIAQQNDTIYYSSKWDKTTKEKAVYYRPLPLAKKGDLFEIKDYYINGVLQMHGFSTKKEEDVFEGKITWYYPNGNVEIIRNYLDNKLEGEVIRYYKDGTLKCKGILKADSYWEGTFSTSNNMLYQLQEYSEGSRIALYSIYEDTKSVAEKRIVEYFDQVKSSIFFDKKGNKISEVFYKNRSGMYLEPLKGSIQYFAYTTNNNVTHRIGSGEIIEDAKVKKIKTTLLEYPKTLIGIYKDGYPHQGYFYKEDGQLRHYKDGKREGEVICCFNQTKIKTKGIYKDGSEYDGTFFDDYYSYNKVSSYKEGELHGKQLIYDAEFNLKSQEIFKEGIKEGVSISENEFTKSTHECLFKDGKPFEGELMQGEILKTYEKGIEVKRLDYDYNTGNLKTLTVYKPSEEYAIDYKEFYRNDETYRLYYKDGSPFKGRELQSFGYSTWDAGSYNGPYEISSEKYKETGNYIDFKKNGEITFKAENGLIYVCEYENGKPITGADYNQLSQEVINYKNGKRNGFYSKKIKNYELYDSIVGQYKNDQQIGTFNYFKKGEKVSSGTFKDGMPYEGVFYDNKNFKKYTKGTLNELLEYASFNKFKVHQLYANGKIIKETTTRIQNGEQKFITEFKNGKPFNGQRFIKDSITKNYILSNYTSGKKSGIETHFKYPFREVIAEKNYVKDKLEGNVITYIKDSTYTCSYLNNKPLSGSFVEKRKSANCLKTFVDGKIKSERCFSLYGKEELYSNTYIDGKPYEGLFIEADKPIVYFKKYEKGTNTKTYISYYSYSSSIPDLDSSVKVIHQKNTDTILFYGSKAIINYKNAKKTSGSVKYLDKEGKDYGFLSFEKLKVIEANIVFDKSREYFIKQIRLEGNELAAIVNSGDVLIKIFLPLKIENSLWLYLYDINKYMSNVSTSIVKIYQKSTNKELSKVIFKNGKPYEGKIILLSTNIQKKNEGLYEIQTYEKGNIIFEDHMTLDEYMKNN